ncbi:unnamed protein product, partial [Meganyctiphanes norvegica]
MCTTIWWVSNDYLPGPLGQLNIIWWPCSIFPCVGGQLRSCATVSRTRIHVAFMVVRFYLTTLSSESHFIEIYVPQKQQIDCKAFSYKFYMEETNYEIQTNIYILKVGRNFYQIQHYSNSCFQYVVFICIYLHVRFKLAYPRLVRPFCQMICISITFYTCVSRIHDYKHHWSDVLSGFIIGSTVAVCIARFVSDLFPAKSTLPTYKSQQQVPLQDYGVNVPNNDLSTGNQ